MKDAGTLLDYRKSTGHFADSSARSSTKVHGMETDDNRRKAAALVADTLFLRHGSTSNMGVKTGSQDHLELKKFTSGGDNAANFQTVHMWMGGTSKLNPFSASVVEKKLDDESNR